MNTSMKIILGVLLVVLAEGRILSKHEFQQELRKFNVAEDKIGTWTCIAEVVSNFDTTAWNEAGGTHGILQISQSHWCSPPGRGCNIECDKLRADPSIEDDIACALKIYKSTERFAKDGFKAWAAYDYCQ